MLVMLLSAIAVALVVLFWSLRIYRREHPQGPRSSFSWLASTAAAIPVIAIFGYLETGASDAVYIDQLTQRWTQAVESNSELADGHALELREALDSAIVKNPDNERFLFLDAQLKKSAGQYVAAEASFARLLELSPEDPQVASEYAQVSYFASNAVMTEDIQQRIDYALALDPQSRPLLALLAIHHYRLGETEQAVQYWRELLVLLPPNSDSYRMIQQTLAQAEQELGVVAELPQLNVRLSLSSDLADAVQQEDVVFVVVRPLTGGAPVAARRLSVSELPVSLVFSDRDQMIEGRNLSAFPQVEVEAFISKSGTAMQSAGDFKSATFSAEVGDELLDVVIDREVQ